MMDIISIDPLASILAVLAIFIACRAFARNSKHIVKINKIETKLQSDSDGTLNLIFIDIINQGLPFKDFSVEIKFKSKSQWSHSYQMIFIDPDQKGFSVEKNSEIKKFEKGMMAHCYFRSDSFHARVDSLNKLLHLKMYEDVSLVFKSQGFVLQSINLTKSKPELIKKVIHKICKFKFFEKFPKQEIFKFFLEGSQQITVGNYNTFLDLSKNRNNAQEEFLNVMRQLNTTHPAIAKSKLYELMTLSKFLKDSRNNHLRTKFNEFYQQASLLLPPDA